MRAVTRLAVSLALVATQAQAHHLERRTATPPGWSWDPWIVVPLLATASLFVLGYRRFGRRSERGLEWRRRALPFALGLILLAAALLSPLHEGGERSFALHMTEHELIMLAASPLLVAGEPLVILLWAFPLAARKTIGRLANTRVVQRIWRLLTEPLTATLLQAAALWLWHAPRLFDAALASDGWHIAQHASFLATSLLFWSAMLGRRGRQAREFGQRAIATLCLFATSIVSGALGALMAFSESPWYRGYARMGMAPFGLTPAEDQQIAGLIMWVPGGLVHAAAALLLARSLLRAPVQPEPLHAR